MTQTIIVLVGLLIIGIFIYDIRRKTLQHQRAIQQEKSDIATRTHMTATMSTFADGKATEALLAATEDSQLFFYRRIVSGKTVARYTIDFSNMQQAELFIDGVKQHYAFTSTHKTANMRATDIAMQARLSLPADFYTSIREITLRVYFKSEKGDNTCLSVIICKNPTPQMQKVLPKTLENAIWWQQYLTILTTATSPMEAGCITAEEAPSDRGTD